MALQRVSHHEWKRWWSMRFIIATAFFSGITAAYVLLPADWLPIVPPLFKQVIAISALATAGCAGVSRVMRQPGLSEGIEPKPGLGNEGDVQ